MAKTHRTGSQWSRLPAALLLALCCALASSLLAGCFGEPHHRGNAAGNGPGQPGDEEPFGSLSAALQVPGYLEAATVHFELTNQLGETRTSDVPLTPGDFASVNDQLDDHAFADWLVVVPVGSYAVSAWLTDANGNRIADCPAASDEVEIHKGETTELTLTTVCRGADSGGLDVTLVVNTAVGIVDLHSDSGKYICLGKAFDVTLTAEDPDLDPLDWTFSVAEAPEGVTESLYCLASSGSQAVFSSAGPGRYVLRAEVTDGGETAALTFPVYVGECGQGRCPGLLVSRQLSGVNVQSQGACKCAVPTIQVSANLPPSVAFVPNVNKAEHQTRTVARYQNNVGKSVDFVDNEMLVTTDDPSKLTALLARWNGQVRGKIDFSSRGIDAPTVYRVGVDPSSADLASFPGDWAIGIGAEGTHTFSNQTGAKLFAAMLSELEGGISVALNPLMVSADFAGHSTLEEPAPEFGVYNTRNAYEWPYMNRASEQDIGTGEAWTVLDAAGRLSNRVRIGIADGGFILNHDLPSDAFVAGSERVRNPASCTGGSPCPWHGTWVTDVLAGVPDNEIGAAGPAGPVAQLTLLPSPAPDFFAYLEYIFVNIPAALSTRPQIINVSAGVSLPREACLFVLVGLPVCETLHGLTSAFRAGGTLIFAAAGNINQDVDELKDYVFFHDEADILLPCELNGVTCVGGLAHDSNSKDPASSFGSLPADSHSVDIFGPFNTFVVDDPAAADDDLATPNTSVSLRGGTSFSSPYVAGVAALVWAANPSLTDDQVENILLSTAHTTSTDPKVPRWVNALGATLRALGRDAPPFLRITTQPTSVPAGASVRLSAVVEEIDGQAFHVEWLREGVVFETGLNRVVSSEDWPAGVNVIQARAIDTAGNTSALDSVEITVVPDVPPPTSVTVGPPDTGTLCPIGPERGDAEFNGAPTIRLQVSLRISPDQSQVIADIDFSETGPSSDPDSSLVTERFNHVLFTAASSDRIVLIESDDTFDQTFVGLAGGFEFIACNDGTPESHFFSSVVNEAVVIADTGAGDISNDSNCACDTQIRNISFQPLHLQTVPR